MESDAASSFSDIFDASAYSASQQAFMGRRHQLAPSSLTHYARRQWEPEAAQTHLDESHLRHRRTAEQQMAMLEDQARNSRRVARIASRDAAHPEAPIRGGRAAIGDDVDMLDVMFQSQTLTPTPAAGQKRRGITQATGGKNLAFMFAD
jgi:hypothetical protein